MTRRRVYGGNLKQTGRRLYNGLGEPGLATFPRSFIIDASQLKSGYCGLAPDVAMSLNKWKFSRDV
jgi:hypothetical protein